MSKKKLDERTIMEGMHKAWAEFRENKKKPIDAEFLAMMFKLRKGNIYFNDSAKIAIGMIPIPGSIMFVSFDMLPGEKLQYTDERGINIDDTAELDLKTAIDFCKVLAKEKKEDNNNDFGYIS